MEEDHYLNDLLIYDELNPSNSTPSELLTAENINFEMAEEHS